VKLINWTLSFTRQTVLHVVSYLVVEMWQAIKHTGMLYEKEA
jgi:hypothetical protein